ncbi:MAG TPA: erythromycin esterase family protein, partial [Chitinophagales bacterium]|nr:erythromycin esterase family protein [Chitinophagales bacterium]
NSTWDDMQAGNFSIDSLRHNIYPIWSKCGQVQPLFTYIKEQYALGSPLIISGMDCRHALSFSQQNYMATFDSMVLQRCLLSQESKTRFRAMLHLLMAKEYRLKPKRSDRDFLFAAIDTLKQQLPYLPAFWKQELDNIKQCAANAWASHPLYTSYRDRQMASNLYWLYHEKYAGRKIIVWAHNAHTGRNFNDGKRKIYYYNETAGNEIHNLLGDTLYTIGFTSLTGTAGRLHTRPYKLAIPKGECFENWIESKKLNYAFVNFRNYTGNETFNMQGIMHWEIKANWTKIFDGEFYIRDMYPCNEVK